MSSSAPRLHHRLVIIGAGFSGIGVAIQLRKAGVTDFVILEKAATLGGTWRDNRYPGCACDVQSHLYEYSFAPNPDWSERYSPSAEIWAYLERCADEFGVRPNLRLGTEVRDARWNASARRWEIATGGGTITADLLIVAVGALAVPFTPSLPGLERFEGPVLHSATWDPSFDPAGKRLAIVGTGASAVQIVPSIQPLVRQLTVFQRTPAWVYPRDNRPTSAVKRWVLRNVPFAKRALRSWLYGVREVMGTGFRHPGLMKVLQRAAERHLAQQVKDPVLRKALTPGFLIGCKRVLVSDDYLPAFTKPNVELVTGAVTAVTAHGVVGPTGDEHPADAIVLCTGFHVTDFPFARHVYDGTGCSLAEHWGPSMTAHVGTTVHGFPNMFILMGPNTGLGHSSVLLMQEAQFAHIVNAVRYMDAHRIATIEPTPEAQAAFVADVDRRMQQTVWVRGGCKSWYLDATGRNSTLWPGTVGQFRRRVSPFNPDEYDCRPAMAAEGMPHGQ